MTFISSLCTRLIPHSYIHALILMLITGCLIGISFPPYHFGFIAFIGFIPLLFSIDYLQNLSKKKQIFSLYVCFLYIMELQIGGLEVGKPNQILFDYRRHCFVAWTSLLFNDSFSCFYLYQEKNCFNVCIFFFAFSYRCI